MGTEAKLTRHLVAGLTLALALPAQAGVAPVEVTGSAQAVGQAHTLRQIPEACVRLEGRFSGQPDKPYLLDVVPISPTCQPRARFEGALADPAPAGWRLAQRIRLPSTECPQQVAVFELWQRDGASPQARDGQGQVRVYLEHSQQQARAGQLSRLPGYATRLQVHGRCPG